MAIQMQLPDQWLSNAVTIEEICYLGFEYVSRHNSVTVQGINFLDCRNLFCFAANISKIDLIKNASLLVSLKDKIQYLNVLKRYCNGEPLSKIYGIKSFYDNDFFVSRNTLDPRPETELLIDIFKNSIKSELFPLKIIDIGTGSGCIAITVAKLFEGASITAIDICENALIIAEKNAQNLGVKDRITFLKIKNDPNELKHFAYDVILCNPPYIPDGARDFLESSVCNYDPEIALFFGDDGLGFYRILAEFAVNNLKDEGFIVIEFGIGQARCIKDIFAHQGFYGFDVYKDFNGILRVAKICF